MNDISINAPLKLSQPVSEWVWNEKYRYYDETLEGTFHRVSSAIAEAGETPENFPYWAQQYYQIISDFSFIPAGRIIAGAGTPRGVTLFNCYVMGRIEDSLDGIMLSLSEAARTLKQGGGVGMDFSSLRPRGAYVKSVDAASSGAVSFMQMWDSMCRTIESAGARRGAMMGTLHISHPDVLEFIEVKKKKGQLTSFNISLLITDEFLEAVHNNDDWAFEFEGKQYGKPISARELWSRIVETTYEYSEPGVIFIDRVNETNALRDIEVIRATNPCGEQPLPPYGACNLGSINLTRFVLDPFTSKAVVDHRRLGEVTRTAIRFLDSIVEASNYPLEQQQVEAQKKRRVGLGITGFADMLIMLGIKYSEGATMAESICSAMQHHAMDASIELGGEKGHYPAWNESHGPKRRNSHLLSIAPTGTISLFAGNISSGIEPVFDFIAKRKLLRRDFSHEETKVFDYAYNLSDHNETSKPYWQRASDLTIRDHLNIVAACQPYIDSGISKTINVPMETPLEDFKRVYDDAYAMGLKGCTTFRPSAVRGAVLSSETMDVKKAEPTPALTIRPKGLMGRTYKSKPAGVTHAYYITINDITDPTGRVRPYELFINSKNVDGFPWIVALSRMVSAVFRKGGDVAFVADELQAVFDPQGVVWDEGVRIPSVCAAVGKIIREHMITIGFIEATEEPKQPVKLLFCPECSGPLRHEEGCLKCTQCTYSKC